jgi:hypothetical protein
MMTSSVNVLNPYIMDNKGQIIPIEHDKLAAIIFRALKAANNPDRLLALNLADKVMQRLITCKGTESPLSIDEVQDMTEFVLFETGQFSAAKELIVNRQKINDSSLNINLG